MDSAGDRSDYDLAIIGGGINGCGIARDAAGRGWRVFLCDKADLASGTSSASTKLIHGGLRYLEYYEFHLVRQALMEREVLWGIAPHIIQPMRFVLPHHRKLRPAWLLRLGLFLYDHLGGRKRLPPTRTLDLRTDKVGALLKPEFTRGFAYSDCRVDDARLVVLNARDAADRGATIAPRTECVGADRVAGGWTVTLRDAVTGALRTIQAKALVNAAGPWVAEVAGSVIHVDTPAPVRLVKGSHIVVPRLYDHEFCYIFQNEDGRIFFLIPYERDFTLIGTTDQDFTGDPAEVHASSAEIAYLCESASAYLRQPVTPDSVVWTYSGVRPLYDDGSTAPQQATRDYVLKLNASPGTPALLSVFGGKITTYRRLAEASLALLAPHLPAGVRQRHRLDRPRPPARRRLPGGRPSAAGAGRRFALSVPRPNRPCAACCAPMAPGSTGRSGTATCFADLGRTFGADLTEAELRYLVDTEWARTAEDVVWRRSKLGLHLSAEQIAAIDEAMRAMADHRVGA